MTIGKKLYVNFGIILSMVVVLFLVNLVAVQREHAAKAAATASLDLVDATDAVRSCSELASVLPCASFSASVRKPSFMRSTSRVSPLSR